MCNVLKILRGELIGKTIKAVHLRDEREIAGKVIDETKHTLVMKTKQGRKRLVKTAYLFVFPYGEKKVRIEGKHFNKKPEDRIKVNKW